jgi:hypothetical protein
VAGLIDSATMPESAHSPSIQCCAMSAIFSSSFHVR